eukprot:m.92470 g.92470  ORF g.92470 m.92470 type:complete len:80 (+) comp12357_c1_seq1:2396-2635(+)
MSYSMITAFHSLFNTNESSFCLNTVCSFKFCISEKVYILILYLKHSTRNGDYHLAVRGGCGCCCTVVSCLGGGQQKGKG